jgi:hypothetical protein
MVQKRLIVWGPDGVPRPSSVPALTSQGITELSTVALSLPYKLKPLEVFPPLGKDASNIEKARRQQEEEKAQRDYEDELEFEGMTNAEVMIIRMARLAAAGDNEATAAILDRTLGRPKQSIESKSMTMTYADVLKEKAARASAPVDAVCAIVRKDHAGGGDLEGLV